MPRKKKNNKKRNVTVRCGKLSLVNVEYSPRPSNSKQRAETNNERIQSAHTLKPEELVKKSEDDFRYEMAMVTDWEVFIGHLKKKESDFDIRRDFLEGHATKPAHRDIIVGWLVEVHRGFNMQPATLHLCIRILDRYLQEKRNMGSTRLQLAATSALLLASRYFETAPLKLKDLTYTYKENLIIQQECDIFETLNFTLEQFTSFHVLRIYTEIAKVSCDSNLSMGKFLLELSLLDHNFSSWPPSFKAAAAFCLSVGILSNSMDLSTIWTPILAHYTKYDFKDLEISTRTLAFLVRNRSSKFRIVKDKYADPSTDQVSMDPRLDGPLIRMLTDVD